MSSRGSRVPPQRGNMRSTRSRKTVRDFDLNVRDFDLNAVPYENRDLVGTSIHASYQDVQGGEQGGSTQPAPIDVEAFDDDVFVSSPRAFAEAKNNSRRHRRSTVVVDVDSVERTAREPVVTRHYKRRRLTAGHTSENNDVLFINLDGNSNSVNVNQPPPPPPPPQETTFTCPVCLGKLEDATSTKCGHIFCQDCLKTALAAQGKCPTCRKKSHLKDTIRIYLPATN